jgi:hypothetical protein
MGRNTFFWVVKRWNPRTDPGASPVRPPSGTVLNLSILPTLLALADEVIE